MCNKNKSSNKYFSCNVQGMGRKHPIVLRRNLAVFFVIGRLYTSLLFFNYFLILFLFNQIIKT